MSEIQPTIPDSAQVMRTPTGEIADQAPSTSTPPSTETIVRPPPTPTKPEVSAAKPTEKSDAKPASGKSLLNEESKEEGAPDKYEDFKTPEGFELDPEVVKEGGALFKKHNLSQSAAQELVDFYIRQTKDAFEAPFNAYVDKRQEWRDEISADPDIGGSKLNGVRTSIGRLLDVPGDPKLTEAFRAAMDYTGAGDNPAVVKWLHAISQKLGEGSPVRGRGMVEVTREGQVVRPGQSNVSAAAAIYPHLSSNADRR